MNELLYLYSPTPQRRNGLQVRNTRPRRRARACGSRQVLISLRGTQPGVEEVKQYKGTTKVTAYCKVCGELSLTEIYTKNQVLAEIAILCREHKDFLLNKITFQTKEASQ